MRDVYTLSSSSYIFKYMPRGHSSTYVQKTSSRTFAGFSTISAPGEAAGNRALEGQFCLEGGGPGPCLPATSEASSIRGSTQLFLKWEVFMLETKLSAIQARDVLMCSKQRRTQ